MPRSCHLGPGRSVREALHVEALAGGGREGRELDVEEPGRAASHPGDETFGGEDGDVGDDEPDRWQRSGVDAERSGDVDAEDLAQDLDVLLGREYVGCSWRLAAPDGVVGNPDSLR